MKHSLLAATSILVGLLLALVCWISPATAANPDHLQQLLQSRACVGCDLSGADLKNADLRGVNLSGANLKDADLRRANLMAVTLKKADLRGANLSSAQMLVVDLSEANLQNADITDANQKQLRLCHTIAPNGKISDRDC